MSEKVFGEFYSNLYDILYENKDYESEIDSLEAIFHKYDLNVNTILDLGCGTGGHLIPLAKRGYHVTGVDRSEYMLKCALKKMKQENVEGELLKGDICSIDLKRQFDVVISMFAVMSYQITNERVACACKTVRKHLNSPGAFIFDVWHGSGVLGDRPTQRIKKINSGNREVVRFTEPTINIESHTVETRFKCWVIEGNEIISKDDETHLMRFFFPQEIAYFLDVAGLDKVNFCPFMDISGKLDESVWNMTVIGRLV